MAVPSLYRFCTRPFVTNIGALELIYFSKRIFTRNFSRVAVRLRGQHDPLETNTPRVCVWHGEFRCVRTSLDWDLGTDGTTRAVRASRHPASFSSFPRRDGTDWDAIHHQWKSPRKSLRRARPIRSRRCCPETNARQASGPATHLSRLGALPRPLFSHAAVAAGGYLPSSSCAE
jgi:hypothetical protein